MRKIDVEFLAAVEQVFVEAKDMVGGTYPPEEMEDARAEIDDLWEHTKRLLTFALSCRATFKRLRL